jgi:FMN-dependent NADH-azoreductase
VSLFRLDASIRTVGSVSRQVADTVQAAWQAEHPDAPVVRRDVGAQPLPVDAWKVAATAGRAPGEPRSQRHVDALALVGRLAAELLGAHAYLFAVPLYNFGVPQQVKGWIDLLLTDPRLGPQGDQPLAGRPGVLVVARGGGYGPGTPREGWDHATPWLRRILVDVFGLDLRVVEAELTLAGVTPAMAALRGRAEQVLREAHRTAEVHGRELAQLVRAGV